MRRYLLYTCFVAMALAMASCGNYEKNKEFGSFVMYCDDSFENIMEQEIDVFELSHPGNVALCRYTTEREAIDSLMDLNARTIVIPRDLSAAEKAQLKKKRNNLRSQRIAVDAVALIVNPENPVDNLSLKEVAQILSGDTKSWMDINPHYPDKPISIIFDNENSSMVKYMRDSLLNGAQVGPNAFATKSIQGVIDAIKTNKNAIGVIGVSWLTSDLGEVFNETIDSAAVANDTISAKDAHLKALVDELNDDDFTADMGEINDRINKSGVKVIGLRRNDYPTAYKPYQQYIYDGSYPLTRSIFMITTAYSNSPAGLFYNFVTGNVGQRLIMKTGVLPARMQVNVIELM